LKVESAGLFNGRGHRYITRRAGGTQVNVLFVFPNISGFYSDGYHFGLASIIAVSRQAGYQCRVVSINTEEDFATLFAEIKNFRPTVVAFTSVSSQFRHVKKIAELIKSDRKDIITVCGGVHPTLAPQDLLDADGLDFFFVGEAEFSFKEFLDKIGSSAESVG
jgi:radical SAM superfamily enzyme YgiQ (UPF0313 family)